MDTVKLKHDGDGKIFYENNPGHTFLFETWIQTGDSVANILNGFVESQLKDSQTTLESCNRARKEAEAEVERLKGFAAHKQLCRLVGGYGPPCDCGLDNPLHPGSTYPQQIPRTLEDQFREFLQIFNNWTGGDADEVVLRKVFDELCKAKVILPTEPQ